MEERTIDSEVRKSRPEHDLSIIQGELRDIKDLLARILDMLGHIYLQGEET